MKDREEKRDATIDRLKQGINQKQPGKVNAAEGSFLLLERIEDLLKEQNHLLREQAGKPNQAGQDPVKRKRWWQ